MRRRPGIDRERVHRAILQVTDGSLENLKRWVEMALYEAKDVVGLVEDPGPAATEEIRRFNTWKLDPETVAETNFADLDEDPGRKG